MQCGQVKWETLSRLCRFIPAKDVPSASAAEWCAPALKKDENRCASAIRNLAYLSTGNITT